MIQLIGPGGAGKTTIGAALAARLRASFVDLDAEFMSRYGDISEYLEAHGYAAYASRNVELFADLPVSRSGPGVVALSSGFMTYPADVHPAYAVCRDRVASSPSTFVMLPSLRFEECVTETVQRQLRRSFARSAEREELVIRARLPIYLALSNRKFSTMEPVEAVVAALISVLPVEDRIGACPSPVSVETKSA